MSRTIFRNHSARVRRQEMIFRTVPSICAALRPPTVFIAAAAMALCLLGTISDIRLAMAAPGSNPAVVLPGGAKSPESIVSLIPSFFDSWQTGSYTVIETRNTANNSSTITRVRTEVTGRTADILDTVATTDVSNTLDIAGRQVVTETHSVMETSMNFSTKTATTSTTITVDGVTTGPFEAEGLIDVHHIGQIPGLVRWAKPNRTEKIMKRGKAIECDIYEIEGKDGKASAHVSKSVPLGGPLGSLVKSSSPFHETILLDFGIAEKGK